MPLRFGVLPFEEKRGYFRRTPSFRKKAQTMSFQDGVSSAALSLEALTTQLMEGTLIKRGTNHKIREMEIRHGQMIQVQGRFMGEVVL